MLLQIILYAGFSGVTVFLGGLLANFFNHHIRETPVKYVITHSMVAFGGGIILSALALVLVPKGLEELGLTQLVISFLSGAVAFFFLDRYLAKKGGKMGTLLAMLMDFIPESVALGAVFANDPDTGILLAVFIGLQNLPEAFTAFRDMVLSGFPAKKTLFIFALISFSGIAAALGGHFFLRDLPEVTGLLMSFASGGILYLIFQDIAPESRLKGSYTTSLWTTVGFVIGIVGEKVI